MAGNMGAVLTGLANGLSNVPQQLNDLAYQQQQRQQQLQSGSIQNQMAALQLQQAQTAQQNQQDYQQAMVSAWQGAQDASSQTASPPVAAGQPAAGSAPQGSGNAYGNLAPLQRAGITLAQLDTLAQQNGVPPEIAYGVIASESQGNPDAVSPKGAQGSFQVMPATAAQPGFGVAPFDPKSPQGAMSYMGAMWKKAGGDPAKFVAMWNAGPGGNPNNPETQGFTKNVAKNAQAYQLSQTATQATQQPSPADQIAVREDAGVDTPPPVYKQAIQAQGQQIQMLQKVYSQAMQQGHPAVAQMVMGQINTLQGQQLELQTKGLAIQKDANEETSKLAAGVNDQSSYNNLRAQIQSNPAMQQAVAGLNLTGNYDLDKNKLQTLADRSVTLKDQSELRIKQAELQIKQQKEQREQAQADAPKIAQQQAVQQDQQRKAGATAQGIPFAPSIQATAPVGTTLAQIQQAQKLVQTQNANFDKANAPAVASSGNVANLAARAYTIVAQNPDEVGGWGIGVREKLSSKGLISSALDAKQQEIVKIGNALVLESQKMVPAGAQRSAATAAMAARIETTKPTLPLHPEVFKTIARDYYVAATGQKQMNKFLDEYSQANPGATKESGLVQWRAYEQSLPTEVYDPTAKELVPNMQFVPTLEDGTVNDKGPMAYKDYHIFFAKGGTW